MDLEKVEQKRQSLSDTMKKEIHYRRGCSIFEFGVSQSITWISVVSSAITTIWCAYGVAENKYRLILAAIATIPAIMTSIESSFKFSARSKLNAAADYDIRLLYCEMETDSDPFEIDKKYIEYLKQLEAGFPGGVVLPSLVVSRPGN